MRVYISGKITGMDERIARNYFDTVENEIEKAGHTAVNPMKLHPEQKDWEWHDYMGEDIKALLVCDAILLLDNWHESKGARIEVAIAKEKGIPVYYPADRHKILEAYGQSAVTSEDR